MTFDEVLARVLELLQKEKRVSYRALKRRFELDDEDIEDLKAEIIDAKQLATDENQKVIVWAAPDHALLPYTPHHLTEQLLTTRSALEGERKQVTVLFCDLADSSGLAQQVDLEAMHQVMDHVLRLLAAAVHRYEGTVNQYLGDGLMALFGAPAALEDHAFRAVQAALAIQETISGYSSQLQRDYGMTVRLRVGLNTGMVVVGRIGDNLRMDYTAIGNTTNLAARLEAMAEPGTILISRTTYRLIEAYVHAEALGPVEIKGQRQPIFVYQVTGRQRWRSRLEINAERGLTTLVGRQRELAQLHQCMARVQAGCGQVVGIVGEAGIGKARLLYEFRRSLGDAPITWLAGHCTAHSQATPYGPILHILSETFDIEEGDNPLQIQEKLRQGLHRLDPHLERLHPYLNALFALPGADDGLKHLEPKDKRQQIFDALFTLATAASQQQPQVLVHENLHWIDQTSEDCLVRLIERLEDFPILVLTTYRPEYQVPWSDKANYTEIVLDDLTEAEAEAMVRTLLGSPSLPAGLMPLIREKSGGNPAFIEEVLHALLERKFLAQQQDAWQWTGDPEVAFPETIQDLARARIDQLDEPVKRTVQTAAVIGRTFSLRLLTSLCEESVQPHLEMLKQLGLIYESNIFPELAYRFKHAVMQDVAYQGLLGPRRQEHHGAKNTTAPLAKRLRRYTSTALKSRSPFSPTITRTAPYMAKR
ncbi:ATP-binding protein [Candidatus Entotheonella palauensis]|uniref:ATP-binding protein n=1 Tax=Candidatus Entotheonella palauensis TaxID=93172 RepID=UPI000B7DC380|nr:adenylate/guanylate cyclase domain-containing protein [Candidatus Entotheonella palauensis]